VPALALVPILAVLVAMLAMSMAASWDVTFGPMLKGLASLFDKATITAFGHTVAVLGWLAAAVRNFEATLRNAIGGAVAHLAWPLAYAIRGVGHAFLYPARALADLAGDTADALWRLRSVVVPRMIAAKTAWIPRHLAALAAAIAALPHITRRIVVHDAPTFVRHTVVQVARAVANPALPRIGRLEREAGALGKRIDSLAKRLTVPLGLAAVGVALSTLGLGWTRCSRVKKLGKRVCGIDDGLLESLLADALLVVGTISLVEFAEGLLAGMDEFTPQIQKFWQAD